MTLSRVRSDDASAPRSPFTPLARLSSKLSVLSGATDAPDATPQGTDPGTVGSPTNNSPFDAADDLEKGLADDGSSVRLLTQPVGAREPWRRCSVFHVTSSADEYHLVSDACVPLLNARFDRQQRRIDFFPPGGGASQQQQFLPSSPSNADKSAGSAPSTPARPKFTMRYSEGLDQWVLMQSTCSRCAQRPWHLTCDFMGKSQQLAFFQHSRKPAGKARVHAVDMDIPMLVGGATSVWCPVAAGRDLGRQPTRGEESCIESLHLSSQLPVWDEEVESLVLNFGNNRSVAVSPMNFMVRMDTSREGFVFQHGKMGQNSYFLDFRHPLSTVQAFALALTSLLWD